MVYNIPTRNADVLAAILILPYDSRKEFLTQLTAQYGPDRLITLCAQFAELARQVEDQTVPAIVYGLGTDEAEVVEAVGRLNLPSILGAVAGARISIKPVPGMCQGCAFRGGSPANQSLVTVGIATDCVDRQEEFYCHEGVASDEEPKRVCAGYRQTMRLIEEDKCT